jgi:hypothetical protein
MAAPLFLDGSCKMAPDNRFVLVVFDQAVYGNAVVSPRVPITKDMLSLTLVDGGDRATTCVISEITKVGGAPLAGGESSIWVYLAYDLDSDGIMTVQVNCPLADTIYNLAGVAMVDTENTGAITSRDLYHMGGMPVKTVDEEGLGMSVPCYIRGIKWLTPSAPTAGNRVTIKDFMTQVVLYDSIAPSTTRVSEYMPVECWCEGWECTDLDAGILYVYTSRPGQGPF